MNVPVWLKLAAASKEELLNEILTTIDGMGGLEEAQKALRQSDKQANWVSTEKFVTAADKDWMKELGEEADEYARVKDNPKEEKPNPEVANVESPADEEEVKPQGPPAEKEKPEKGKMSQQEYLKTLLLGLGIGMAGTLGGQALSHINLKHELLQAVEGEKSLHDSLNNWLQKELGKKEHKPKPVANPMPGNAKVELPPATTEDRAAFGKAIREAAAQVDMQGIPVEVIIPHLALETGWGRGDIFQKTNNPGSIKGKTEDGSYKDTAVYPTLQAGLERYVQLLHTPRYAKALEAARNGDVNKFADELQAAGYEVPLEGTPYSDRIKNFRDRVDTAPANDISDEITKNLNQEDPESPP
jgi:flagellum-specific peptidoglycan hydrolase FlgJ